MKFPTAEAKCAEVAFKIHPSLCGVSISNVIAIPLGQGHREGNRI